MLQSRAAVRASRWAIGWTLVVAALILPAIGAPSADCPDRVTEALAAYRIEEFARSADLFGETIRCGRIDARVFYDAACSSARAGRVEEALERLERALAAGMDGLDRLQNDIDLTSLRGTARWQSIVTRCRANAEAVRKFWSNDAVTSPFSETLTEDQRIAGLSRVWWEVKMNFVNFDLVPDLDWDALYMKYLPRARAAASTLDYYMALAEMCAMARDGHTSVIFPKELGDRLFSRPPVRTRFVDGQVLVSEILGDPGAAALSVGDVLTEVEGLAVAEFAARNVRPYQSASTPQSLDLRVHEDSLLSGAAGTSVSVGVRRADGSRQTARLARLTPAELGQRAPPAREFELRQAGGGIAHVLLNTFGSPKAADQFEENLVSILGAKGLILDVRRNEGGNSGVGFRILSHLIEQPRVVTRWRTRQYSPVYRAWGWPTEPFGGEVSIAPAVEAGRFHGPVVVLTSARTLSAAEDFTAAFRVLARGKIIGQTTGGSTGQPIAMRLPGGGSVRICAKRDVAADGTDWIGSGIVPDIEMRLTVADVVAGRDRALDRAVEEIAKGR